MDEPSKHDLKELKRLEREKELQEKKNALEKEKRNKRIIKISLISIPVIIFLVFIFLIFRSPETKSYTENPIHWHASLTVSTCAQPVAMPKPIGEHHLGLPLLHTHEDGLIHIEGKIWKPEEIMLGKYLEVIGINFKDNELLEYKNGDLCNDKPGIIKLYVNGRENKELTRYVIQDSDKIEVKFE